MILFQKKFTKIVENISKEKLKVLAKDIRDISIKHFEKGFDNGGGQTDDSIDGWQPLKLTTIRRKGNSNILVDTGKLSKSLRSKIYYVGRGRNQISIMLYSNDPKAEIHNEGGWTGKTNIPKREFLGNSKQLNRIIGQYIRRNK